MNDDRRLALAGEVFDDHVMREGLRIYRARPRVPVEGTVVLLHGFTGHPASWDQVVPPLLDAGRTVLAPALPGHDPGSHAIAGESFRAAANRIDRAISRELAAGTAVLAGYSMGARVALWLVSLPARWLARAVLVGGRAGLTDPAARAGRRAWEAGMATRLREEGMEPFLETWESLPLWTSQQDVPAERAARQRALRAAHDPRELASAMESLGLAGMPPPPGTLPATRVTLLAGERDGKFTDLARELLSVLPYASLTVAPGVGHNIVLEAPDVVTRSILEGDIR